MRIYTIIGGVNGVGKSSFTGVLKSRTTDLGIIVDVDKITGQVGDSAIEGDKAASRIMEGCISRGISFTHETTLSGHRTERIAQRLKSNGYYIRLYYVGLDTAEESKRRIANRVSRGGHNINTEDVDRRFAGRWDAVRKVLPYCDEAAFYDNDNGFIQVATYRNGELILEGDYRPRWLVELTQYLNEKNEQGTDR